MNNENFSNQSVNHENFHGRSFHSNQFGFRNEYDNHHGYPNPLFNKNPLNNLEDLSTNNFQSKRFFPHSGSTGNSLHAQYGNATQNFDSSGQRDASFNQTNSNESGINSSFNSSLNSNNSSFNQSELSKTYDYNHEFNPEFYPLSNFQNPSHNNNNSNSNNNNNNNNSSSNNNNNNNTSSNYSRDNKSQVFTSSSSYFHNTGFRNSENFDYQSSNVNANFANFDRSNSNFQTGNGRMGSNQRLSGPPGQVSSNYQSSTMGTNFQNANSNLNPNYSSNFQNSNLNFESGRFNNANSQNFQTNNFEPGRSKSYQEPTSSESNFSNTSYEHGFWHQTNWMYPESGKNNTGGYRETGGSNNNFLQSQKFNAFDGRLEPKQSEDGKNMGAQSNNSAIYQKLNCDYLQTTNEKKNDLESKVNASDFDESKGTKTMEEEEKKEETLKTTSSETTVKKEDTSLPYDWVSECVRARVSKSTK